MSKRVNWMKYAIKCENMYLGKQHHFVHELRDAIQCVTRTECETIINGMPKKIQSLMEVVSAMKFDAKFTGTIRKVKDGSVVPEDQYVVFLIKDNAFADILPLYRTRCIELGCDTEHIEALDRMLERMYAWREANPDKCKNPDAHGERLLDQM